MLALNRWHFEVNGMKEIVEKNLSFFAVLLLPALGVSCWGGCSIDDKNTASTVMFCEWTQKTILPMKTGSIKLEKIVKCARFCIRSLSSNRSWCWWGVNKKVKLTIKTTCVNRRAGSLLPAAFAFHKFFLMANEFSLSLLFGVDGVAGLVVVARMQLLATIARDNLSSRWCNWFWWSKRREGEVLIKITCGIEHSAKARRRPSKRILKWNIHNANVCNAAINHDKSRPTIINNQRKRI